MVYFIEKYFQITWVLLNKATRFILVIIANYDAKRENFIIHLLHSGYYSCENCRMF